ncbi:MAG: hypothetical protein AAGC65_13025 [Mucilaginibacter sp.]|uniref:hypothetical protein n=1 Tax=Mucilaginibacter sp. TaxID=1882438 RepID=UPI0031AFBBE6
MIKKVIILAFLLITVIVGFIPVTASVGVHINAQYVNLLQQLQVAHNWIKWQPQLKQAGSDFKVDSTSQGFHIKAHGTVLKVKFDNSSSFTVTQLINDKQAEYNYTVGPDSSINNAIIIVSYKTNLLGYWRSKFSDQGIKDNPVWNVKAYMEDTQLYYGFKIERRQTEGKLMLVKKMTVPKTGWYSQSNQAQVALNNFINNNQLHPVDVVQVQVTNIPADSVQLMVGIAINKKANVAGTPLQLQQMPAGKILVGYYRGLYKNKQKIYGAMQLYIQDKYLHSLILPIEKFTDNKLPQSDNDIVNMQVIIPYI